MRSVRAVMRNNYRHGVADARDRISVLQGSQAAKRFRLNGCLATVAPETVGKLMGEFEATLFLVAIIAVPSLCLDADYDTARWRRRCSATLPAV